MRNKNHRLPITGHFKKTAAGKRRIIIEEAAAGVCLILVLALSLARHGEAYAAEDATMDIVFTHDIHSYLDSYEVTEGKETLDVGGLARLKTLLEEKRKENPDTLVVDAGDFSMGTSYHTVFTTEALEYRMLGQLGFDATTLGNHEFDFGSEGLADMFDAAASSGDPLAPVVLCNVDWDNGEPATGLIKNAMESCGLADYIILQKGDRKVAVTGVFGKDALECAPTCELTFQDPIECVKKTVAEIKEKEAPDLIVCLSHGGTWSDPDLSEDEQLAKAVPDLDVIISGHTHTTLAEPIQWGDTFIVSCGAYGRNTGTLSLTQTENGRWQVEQYALISMDDAIEKDEEVQAELDGFREAIDAMYFNQFGYSADQVLAENTIQFEAVLDLEQIHTEHALGNLMADAYRYTLNHLSGRTSSAPAESEEQESQGEQELGGRTSAAPTESEEQESKGEQHPGAEDIWVDVAVVPAGVVRGTYVPGDITAADVFDSFSLGSGPDQIPGYPLIRVYLTGEELQTAAEVDATVSDFMVTARLYLSGLSFTFNPNRIPLDKVTDIRLNPEVGSDDWTVLEKDRLYSVVTDLYTGQMLSAVSQKSFGILKLVPKNADGTPVEQLEDCIVYDADGREVKAWIAIASYLESFPENADGISEIPDYYASSHDRKVIDDSKNIFAILKNPGKYGKMIYGVLAGAAAVTAVLIYGLLRLVRKLCRRRRKH